MTWFLRKAFRLGPLRLNLSKRGLGASVGVKGARIGVDAAGKPYAAGGRYGLYFRQRLGGRGRAAEAPVPPMPAPSSAEPQPRRWWLLVVLALLVGLIVGAWLAGGPR